MSRPAVAFRPDPEPGRAADALTRGAHLVLLARGGRQVRDLLEQLHDNDVLTRTVLERAAVLPATTTGSGWADKLAASAVSEFLGSLAESAGARLLIAALRLDMSGVRQVVIPGRAAAPTGDMGFIAQGAPIPVRADTMTDATLGPPCKIGAIAVVTRELAEHASGEAVVAALLRESASLSLDAALFSDDAAVEGTRPAGLLAGVSATGAAAGGGDTALLADLEALGGAVADATGSAQVVYIAAPRQALAANLRLASLGSAVTVWPSAALSPGVVICVAVGAIVSGFDPVPLIEPAPQATLHMDTSPAAIGTTGTPNVVAAPVRSLWQTDSLGVRVILKVAWALRVSGAVAWLSGASWG